MPNSWSKEDRAHYQSSEVWQELEKSIVDTVHRAEILQRKIAADVAQEANENMNLLEKVKQKAQEVKETVKSVFTGDAQDDEVADDESAEDGLIEDGDDLQDEVVDDLRSLARAAIEEGNIKLAYKIERTIDEILEQEVTCV